MKVWSGSAWAEKPAKVWSGSAWVTKPVKVWSGSAWVVKPAGGGPTAPTTTLTTSFTPGSNRNDFTGEVGVRWAVGAAPITITWMGMYVTAAGGSRTVRLYDWSGDTVLRTVTFDFTGKTPGTWVWMPITSLTLLAATYYAAMHATTASDGLAWADAVGSTVTSIPEITQTAAAYRVPASALEVYTSNVEYVGLDLGW